MRMNPNPLPLMFFKNDQGDFGTDTKERPWEDQERWYHVQAKDPGLGRNPFCPKLGYRTCSLQICKEINYYGSSHQVPGTLLWQPLQTKQTKESEMAYEMVVAGGWTPGVFEEQTEIRNSAGQGLGNHGKEFEWKETEKEGEYPHHTC